MEPENYSPLTNLSQLGPKDITYFLKEQIDEARRVSGENGKHNKRLEFGFSITDIEKAKEELPYLIPIKFIVGALIYDKDKGIKYEVHHLNKGQDFSDQSFNNIARIATREEAEAVAGELEKRFKEYEIIDSSITIVDFPLKGLEVQVSGELYATKKNLKKPTAFYHHQATD